MFHFEIYLPRNEIKHPAQPEPNFAEGLFDVRNKIENKQKKIKSTQKSFLSLDFSDQLPPPPQKTKPNKCLHSFLRSYWNSNQ